ncbi:MAG TPA: gliding motility-associated C-terminal domain-containing protein [Bacteroidales bacterium]
MRKTINILITLLTLAATSLGQQIQKVCEKGTAMRYNVSGPDGMLFHWRVEGGNFATKDTLNDTIFVSWNSSGFRKLSVYGEMNGCFTNWKELQVEINPTPKNIFDNITDDTLKLCDGEQRTIEVVEGFKAVEWSDHSTNSWFLVNSAQTVWAKVTNEYNCSKQDTIVVSYHPLPVVNLGNDTILCKGSLRLNAYNEGATYQWNLNGPDGFPLNTEEIEITPGERLYSVAVTNVYGCTGYDTIRILACNVSFDASKILTVITPGNDGHNDVWDIPGLNLEFPNATVEIYDRWGRIVFKSAKGYPVPWDGKNQQSGKIAAMDSYFYIIKLNDKRNQAFYGTITVIR